MNPIQDLIASFQQLVAQVPDFLQPFIVALAGAVPFIEGEGAGPIGVIGGIHPIVAGVFAAVGNFLAVLVVVTVSVRARNAAMRSRAARREAALVGAGGGVPASMSDATGEPAEAKPESKGKRRFKRWLVRFGVPGASLLGPLAIPTHITAGMLAASGTKTSWILLWQGIAIAMWTTITTTLFWFAVSAIQTAAG